MFLDLFYQLRDEGVPVAIQEWLTLMQAIAEGQHGGSLMRFYHISRATLVKSETYFDSFDRVFSRVFQGVEGEFKIEDEVLAWLNDPKNHQALTEEQRAMLERLTQDELMKKFLETLAEQTERQDGGGKWVRTGGRSPYGNNGEHPTGIRVGGESKNRSAMKVWDERRFMGYRTDLTMDLRQTKVALKRLRQLTRIGPEDELDIDATIDTTCKNAGEIALEFRAERKNQVRLLLLMDVGGTMDPYYEPVSRLLTALHEERGLRDFKAYYFHNCIYDHLYKTADMNSRKSLPTGDILRKLNHRWKLLVVGDAAMNPAELLEPYGNIDPRLEGDTPGIKWLHRLNDHFERSVWLNPDSQKLWGHTHTTRIIQNLFPMFHLSVDGISEAVQALIGAKTSLH